MTERQQIERLMAIVKQARDAQKIYFKNRKSASGSHVKDLLTDARIKENSLDNLVTQLERQGYIPNKHELPKIEQKGLF
jgi:chromosome segregation ATPase